jgi:alkylated DNA repair dioxygenase AlkB
MTNLLPYDGTLCYNEHFYSEEKATLIYSELKKYQEYEQRRVKLFGKEFDAPRLEAFYSKNEQEYRYSGQTLKGNLFTPMIQQICNELEAYSGSSFNSVLVNLYRDGKDSNGWHSDNEKELGKNPIIASLSLGADRNIHFKHENTQFKKTIKMVHGSLLIMGGTIQHHWKHQVPKSSKIINPRINMTFRWIHP